MDISTISALTKAFARRLGRPKNPTVAAVHAAITLAGARANCGSPSGREPARSKSLNSHKPTREPAITRGPASAVRGSLQPHASPLPGARTTALVAAGRPLPAAAAAAAAALEDRDDQSSGICSSDGGEGGHGDAAAMSSRAAAKIRHAWHRPDVAVVLVMPQIPQNTGNVARTCAATATPLHLVGPLGFQLDNTKLKRAGLDYWDAVAVSIHPTWACFFDFFKQLPQPKRLVAFTVYGEEYYAAPEFCYRPGDWLVFGAETSGLPPGTHDDVRQSGGALVKIPIRDTHVRSINLAVSAGVGLFEAIRQLDEHAGHAVSPRQSPTLQEVAARHRDGKRIG